jgi:hypothetical protein
MQSKTLDIEIRPRAPFREFLNCKKRWMTIVAHRRAGKTVGVIQKLILEALTYQRKGMETAPPRYFYICPTLSQAKSVSWSYLLNFTADIPNIVANHSELRITFPNRAEIRLLSGENAERARGLYADGIVLDEADDIPNSHFNYIFLPCLLDYSGWMIQMGTPKGKGNLYKGLQSAKEDPDKHYGLVLKASETGIVSEDDLGEIRAKIGEDAYQQEMECNFSVARAGAIYSKEINEARDQGRILDFGNDGSQLVHTSWDLGSPENTVCVYWSRDQHNLTYKVVDCDFGLNMTTAERVAHMISKGYNYGQHFLPHDGRTRGADNMSFQAKLFEAGLKNVVVLPNAGYGAEEKRIRSMKDMFGSVFFHERVDVEDGLIDALDNYHNREDKKDGRVTNVVVHDWCSHFADAFGYFGEALKNGLVMGSMTPKALGRAKSSFGKSL